MDNSLTKNIYQPLLYRLTNPAEKSEYELLLQYNPQIKIYDEIEGQLKELIKSLNPSIRIKPEEYNGLMNTHLKGQTIFEYGAWVYYPWNNSLIHLLDEEEFIEVRTNRNKYKITDEEQKLLRTKKIGIIGLSVGQSIALTLAMERTCGELRLADFDTAELSNLNRIRTGLQNLGIHKTVIAAREIAEIDPFIKVKIFSDGLHKNNMNDFFLKGGKLDLLVEVCDGLDIKIESRYKARELKIPVVMDTNDRGMLDVERFDLEPERPILHGLIGDVDSKSLASLSTEEKIPIVLKIASMNDVSVRGKASMIEIGQTISTWPQLASSVVLGGAVVTDTVRRLFLDELISSGRYYVDLDEVIPNKKNNSSLLLNEDAVDITSFTDKYFESIIDNSIILEENERITLTDYQLTEIVNAGIAAPSTGNDQPWKWYFKDNMLYVFHVESRAKSFGNYNNNASYLTFGAVYENVVLKAHELSLEANAKIFPLGNKSPLIFSFYFTKDKIQKETYDFDYLAKYIYSRSTNRNKARHESIDKKILQQLKNITESVNGCSLTFITEHTRILKLANIIGICDKIRILNQKGHNDFVNREMRWTKEQVWSTHDGIDIGTLGLSPSQISALEVIRDYSSIDFIKKIKGGSLFKSATIRSIENVSAIGLVSIKEVIPNKYIYGGRANERLWLACEHYNLALHPVISPVYLFMRLENDLKNDLSEDETSEIRELKETFNEIFSLSDELTNVFLFKLSYAEKPSSKSLRIPIEKVLIKY